MDKETDGRKTSHRGSAEGTIFEPECENHNSRCHGTSEGPELQDTALPSGKQEGKKTSATYVVGDARANLDDIKHALLSYYGRLYSNDSLPVTERLCALSSTFRERSDGVANRTSYGPSRRLYGVGAHKEKQAESAVWASFKDPAAEFNTAMTDLRKSCEAATYKLNALSDVFYPQLDNPGLREWIYVTSPQVRCPPRTEGRDELRKHATGLYRHLHQQAELNQERINALQSKVKILYMHTKPQMLKAQQDPRVGL